MRKVTVEGVQKIKELEGFRSKPYQCSSGVWTQGYGHTNNITERSREITHAEAEELLIRDLFRFEERVNRLVKVPLTDGQFNALVSFDFNTGALHDSTLLKMLNAGNYDAVPAELMKWVKAKDPKTGKKVTVQGLVNRRAAECGMWAKGSFVSSNTIEALPKTPPVVDKETVTWGAGILTGFVGTANGDGPVQWVLGAVIALTFAIGLFLFVKKRRA